MFRDSVSEEDDLVSSGDSGITMCLNRLLEIFVISFRSDFPILFYFELFRSFGGPNVLRGGGCKTPTPNFRD